MPPSCAVSNNSSLSATRVKMISKEKINRNCPNKLRAELRVYFTLNKLSEVFKKKIPANMVTFPKIDLVNLSTADSEFIRVIVQSINSTKKTKPKKV